MEEKLWECETEKKNEKGFLILESSVTEKVFMLQSPCWYRKPFWSKRPLGSKNTDSNSNEVMHRGVCYMTALLLMPPASHAFSPSLRLAEEEEVGEVFLAVSSLHKDSASSSKRMLLAWLFCLFFYTVPLSFSHLMPLPNGPAASGSLCDSCSCYFSSTWPPANYVQFPDMLPKAPQQKNCAPQYMQWFLILGPDLLALIRSLGEVVVYVLHFSMRTEALQSRRIYDFFFRGGLRINCNLLKLYFWMREMELAWWGQSLMLT